MGQKCNLRCKNCCHLIPRVEQGCYDVDGLIGDCRRMLSWCEVELFSIVGREPFCNPQIWKLLRFVSDCDDIRTGKVITNGTVFPDERTLEILVRLNGKLEVRVDDYPGTERRVEKFQKLMEENKIRYHITWFNPQMESSWKKLNPPKEAPYSVEKNRFEHVQIRSQKNSFAAKARIATCIDNHMYKDYCRYCRSLSERNTCFVIPGEQTGAGKG